MFQANVAGSSRRHPVQFDQSFQKTPAYTSSPSFSPQGTTLKEVFLRRSPL
jgi:hypothetical protein